MNFPISIGWTSLFQILGVLGGIFHFYSNSNRKLCKQTVETDQTPRSVASDLVCAVCVCPKNDAMPIGVNHPTYVVISADYGFR